MSRKRKTTRRRKPAKRKAARTRTRTRTVTRYKTRTRTVKAKPRRRRRSGLGNPRGLIRLPGGLPGIDLKTALFVGTGMAAYKLGPTLVAKVWPGVPRFGWQGYAVRVGGLLTTGMAVKMITKSNARATQVVAGGLGIILFDLAQQYLLPMIGLSGHRRVALAGDQVTLRSSGVGRTAFPPSRLRHPSDILAA